MNEDKKKTAVGKFFDRFLKDGEMGSMTHEFGTVTILKLVVGIALAAVVIFAIKKYIFKLK